MIKRDWTSIHNISESASGRGRVKFKICYPVGIGMRNCASLDANPDGRHQYRAPVNNEGFPPSWSPVIIRDAPVPKIRRPTACFSVDQNQLGEIDVTLL